MVEIGRTRRVKRVSWAPGLSLCQVRLFLSEDAPCQSGLSSQDHLQAKNSWTGAGSTSDDFSLPPGFETVHNHPKTDISKIPLIRWKCPTKIVLNPEWYVVAGGESQEIAKQNERNIAVLEAIYPRQSTIPPNPSVSAEALESCPDDSAISLVPLTAIEELEDKEPSDPFDSQKVHSEPSLVVSHQSNSVSHPTTAPSAQVQPSNVSVSPSLPEMLLLLSRLGAHADVAAATAAAITAVKSAEQGNLIDQDLLIKILSDPSLVGLLLPENKKPIPQPPQTTTSSMAMSAPLPLPPLPSQHSAHLFNRNMNDPNSGSTRPVVPTTSSGPPPPLPPSLHHNAPPFNTSTNTNTIPRPPQSMVTSTVSTPLPSPPPPQAHILPPFSNVRPSMISPVATPPPPPSQPQIIPTTIRPLPSVNPVKDPNYYKTLIKQHGGEILGSTNPDAAGIGAGAKQTKGQQNGVSDGTNQKVKTCAFFNTARGCKHGDNCFFIHDSSINVRNDRAKKRVKR